jgi:hypothetical protein
MLKLKLIRLADGETARKPASWLEIARLRRPLRIRSMRPAAMGIVPAWVAGTIEFKLPFRPSASAFP